MTAVPEKTTNGSIKVENEDDVLDLTSINHRIVKLPTKDNPKGEMFELRLLDDFPIARQQKLLNYQRKFQELWSTEDDLSEDSQTKLKFYLDELFNAVLSAPAQTRKQMDDAVRNRVVTAFSLAPLLARQEVEQRRRQESQEEMLEFLMERDLLSKERANLAREELGLDKKA